jgi:hypothetical protein
MFAWVPDGCSFFPFRCSNGIHYDYGRLGTAERTAALATMNLKSLADPVKGTTLEVMMKALLKEQSKRAKGPDAAVAALLQTCAGISRDTA